ncbi:MAG: hypothetical protein JOZ02_10840 [Acidobacteria bacterium]|nr:hypothetical protein [Acidobacteriota bacterium]
MSDKKYLEDILDLQTLDPDGQEMKDLRARRGEVEKLLRRKFDGCSLTIRYGGSKAKGTMIKEAYDLDMTCYFDRDETGAGDTLQEIYENVEGALADDYLVTRKPSALRLKSKDLNQWAADFHIDVVPGRFIDEKNEDVFLYRSSGEKGRQKTNLDVHIEHVKNSGVTDAIRLLKLWRARNFLSVRHFVLELLTIELLKGKKSLDLPEQLKHVWTELRDNVEDIKIEDPANPTGNDLSELFNATVRQELSSNARRTLELIERSGWEAVFGKVPEKSSRVSAAAGYTGRSTGSFGEE